MTEPQNFVADIAGWLSTKKYKLLYTPIYIFKVVVIGN